MLDLLTFGLAGLWVLVWMAILIVVVKQKLSGQELGEGEVMPQPPTGLHRLQRYLLWAFIALFLGRFLAAQLGWGEPFPY